MRLEDNEEYDPELWISVYRYFDRYLENVSKQDLEKRLGAIRRNWRVLVAPGGEAHPITSFYGALYWARKETITCEEFRLRGLEPPAEAPQPPARSIHIPASLTGKQRGGDEYVVRYDTFDHLRLMLEEGRVYLGPAIRCSDPSLGAARHDDELRKSYFSHGKDVRVAIPGGIEIPVVGDLRRTSHLETYYFLSTSYEFDAELFEAFGRDGCLIIHYPMEFASRLKKATAALFRGWHFNHFPVEYFDPYEKPSEQVFGAPVSKDFWYAFEKEYRFFWQPTPGGVPVSSEHFVTLGPLHDIAEIYQLD